MFYIPFLSSPISSADACVRRRAACPYILSFMFITFLLTLDYDILGLRIEGESPDGAPHVISVSRYKYKCAMCADQQCYLRVLQLFLLETLVAPLPETVPFTAHILIA
jgi:hypothetical protein